MKKINKVKSFFFNFNIVCQWLHSWKIEC